MKVESIAECSMGAFCNTFDLYLAIIDIENQFLVFFFHLRQVHVYDRQRIQEFSCRFLNRNVENKFNTLTDIMRILHKGAQGPVAN